MSNDCWLDIKLDIRFFYLAGTPIYLSPEVVRQHYSLSADVWSTGIVAYLLLTGRLPFAGEEGIEVTELFMSKQVGFVSAKGRHGALPSAV